MLAVLDLHRAVAHLRQGEHGLRAGQANTRAHFPALLARTRNDRWQRLVLTFDKDV